MNTIGEPISRADGRLKVTGRAAYTADIPLADAAHAAIVHSTIANGRTVSIDTRTAEKAPGVLAVFTHRNMPRMNPTPKPWSHLHPHGQGYLPLQDDKIHYAGQPIALVVATTRDQAMHAATLVAVQYQAERAVFFSRETAREAVDPPQFLWPVASSVGDAEKGIREGVLRIDADLHDVGSPPQSDGAARDGGGLGCERRADTLRDHPAHLRRQGIGFDRAWRSAREDHRHIPFPGRRLRRQGLRLAAHAADRDRRQGAQPARPHPADARADVFDGRPPAGDDPDDRVGCGQTGKLTGIRHESISPTPVFDNYIEYAAMASRHLWAAERGNRDKPQDRPCKPQHADRDALTTRGSRPFRARERYG